MTASQFEEIWVSRYALTPPISYLLRCAYPDRWFRIHSLPESERYPRNDSEWRILLDRQNTLISDLLGADFNILLVTGDYDFSPDAKSGWTFSPGSSIRHLSFIALQPVPLETLNTESIPDEYRPGDIYRPVFSELHWQTSAWDSLLIELANDEFSAFFISVPNELIIAPYDGGVDIILKDKLTRDTYKAKYKDWLSAREDGL